MPAGLPGSLDDPRLLLGWYHTIELGDGVCSKGMVDLRETVDLHLPTSLEGKTALDIGTCDGFWAFEMEARGAQVVAIDVETWSDFDLLPSLGKGAGRTDRNFNIAHAMRGSRVERKICSVYDLSPDFGMFDFVFCGSLLMHLQNPLGALVNIRSVTTDEAVIATLHYQHLEEMPDRPLLEFGHRGPDLLRDPPRLGASCLYWHFNTRGLREMMEYAGFARTEPLGLAPLTGVDRAVSVVVAGYTQ